MGGLGRRIKSLRLAWALLQDTLSQKEANDEEGMEVGVGERNGDGIRGGMGGVVRRSKQQHLP